MTNFVMKRDAGTFHLKSGTVCFLAPVQGKVTGAVFVGDGNLVLEAPMVAERNSLKLLTKESEYVETFSQMVMRFTDTTYDEIKKAGTPFVGSCDGGLLSDNLQIVRKRLRYNLTARILQDVLSPPDAGLFVAFIHGKHYCDKTVFALDPHGAPPFAEETFREFALSVPLAPEEVELMTYEDNKHGYWGAFHLGPEYQNGTATGTQKNNFLDIEHQTLDTTIEKNGNLTGQATATIVSNVNGLRVVPFDLFQKLRVQKVTAADGSSLPF
ncbi:MAG TPA: hypothetical protein VLL05_13955, partial [Terriglobales bacterium]|nr:hypothetical protein [Terriglobales bacterium]